MKRLDAAVADTVGSNGDYEDEDDDDDDDM